MLEFPKTTEYAKRIPKQKFYENISVTPTMRRVFVEQIKNIYWRNKLAPSTLNLGSGESVNEIEFFEIKLNQKALDESVLRQIDREIPYHIVFLLEYEGQYQVWTAYKTVAGSGTNAFKVDSYYHTDWLPEAELSLKIDGLNMDAVYESFVRQIAGETLSTGIAGETLADTIARDEQRKALEKQIAALETKLRREKQLNRQMEINAELKQLKKRLENLI